MKPAQPEFNMGNEPFRLVQETATDGDRLAAEARRRDQDRASAAERQRPILFVTPSGGQFTDTATAIIHPGFRDMTTDEREAAIAAETK